MDGADCPDGNEAAGARRGWVRAGTAARGHRAVRRPPATTGRFKVIETQNVTCGGGTGTGPFQICCGCGEVTGGSPVRQSVGPSADPQPSLGDSRWLWVLPPVCLESPQAELWWQCPSLSLTRKLVQKDGEPRRGQPLQRNGAGSLALAVQRHRLPFLHRHRLCRHRLCLLPDKGLCGESSTLSELQPTAPKRRQELFST